MARDVQVIKFPTYQLEDYSLLTYFPKYCSQLAIGVYLLALMAVSFLYINYAMYWYWWVIGIVSVVGFFYFTNVYTRSWARLSERSFIRSLFSLALLLRVITVFFLYWFFYQMNGTHFMFAAADSAGYHEVATDFVAMLREGSLGRLISENTAQGVSDFGYPFYLSLVYLISGESIIFARLLKAVWSALTCVLVYRIAKRNFGEPVGRMAAIFCMLMPNLIYYCGVHLKETEMTFLLMAFTERADYVIHKERYDVASFVSAILLAISLFFFRTVLGAAAVFSFVFALIFTNQRVASLGRRWLMLIALAVVALYFVGGRIFSEMQGYWEDRETNQQVRIEDRARKGNVLARYASSAVFAPMIFTLPFPTMVETPNQETARLLHGGNVVKNIMSGFVIFAMFAMFLSGLKRGNIFQGEWRDHLLIEAVLIAYLGILAMSAFAHAERFHMPAIPLEMIFAAVGVSRMTRARERQMYTVWCLFMFVVFIGWNWFKMKGRGWT